MTVDEEAYFRDLSTREARAPVPTFMPVTCAGVVQRAGMCHPNAEIFVSKNDGYTRVRGWLNENSVPRWAAHSVVEDRDGRLFEITSPHRFRFVRHIGDPSVFDELSKKYPAPHYRIEGLG